MAIVKGTPRGVWRARLKGIAPEIWPGETFDPVFLEGDEGAEVQVRDPETGEYFVVAPAVVAELEALRGLAEAARKLIRQFQSDRSLVHYKTVRALYELSSVLALVDREGRVDD